MKKFLFSILCIVSCTPANSDIVTNTTSQLSTQPVEQLDCHDPTFDICVAPDYSKDICLSTQDEEIEVYVTDVECKDDDEKTCR